MLFEVPEDVLRAVTQQLGKKASAELLSLCKDGFEKTAPLVYRHAYISSIKAAASFKLAMNGPRGSFLAPLVDYLDIRWIDKPNENGKTSMLFPPMTQTNVLSSVIPRMVNLRRVCVMTSDHFLGIDWQRAVLGHAPLKELYLTSGPRVHPIGIGLQPSQHIVELEVFVGANVCMSNKLLVGVAIHGSSTLRRLAVDALRAAPESPECFFQGLPTLKWPALKELHVSALEDNGVSVDAVGLGNLLRGADLSNLNISANRIQLCTPPLLAAIGQQSHIVELCLTSNFGERPNDHQALFDMVRALPSTLRILEISEAAICSVAQPTLDLRRLLTAFRDNADMSRGLTSLTLGFLGLRAAHYKIMSTIFLSLEKYVELVVPSAKSYLALARDLTAGFGGHASLKRIVCEVLEANGLTLASSSPTAMMWKMLGFEEIGENGQATQQLISALPALDTLAFCGFPEMHLSDEFHLQGTKKWLKRVVHVERTADEAVIDYIETSSDFQRHCLHPSLRLPYEYREPVWDIEEMTSHLASLSPGQSFHLGGQNATMLPGGYMSVQMPMM